MVTLEALAAREALLASTFTAVESKATFKGAAELFGPAVLEPITQPARPIVDRFPGNLIDTIELPTFPKLPVESPDFESNYGGLIDAINTLSDQINDKKAQLEDPNLTPEQRMQLGIELQELMQMRLQMITMTTNLLKAEHDSNMAITNNLRG